ncbi:hypothetical protein A33M_0809 [Rhodovulum sp. PH10]|nr:hypothetical protein A33M_0809 [Rhodovulum sp. PH10]
MDTSLTIRPPIGVTSADAARPVTVEAPVVPTVLPSAKAVTAPTPSSESATDPKLAQSGNPPAQSQPAQNQALHAQENTTRQVVLDPQTREVVFRVIDSKSRQVLRQIPEEALLRMRAYNRALQDGTSPAEVMSRADLRA